MSERREGRHPDEATLNRLAERGLGETPPDVGRHVRACEACREEVAAIRRLLRAARELPPGLPPDGDLWPGVEARIRAGEGGAGRATGSTGSAGSGSPAVSLREAGPWLAAAAAVLVAVTAGATLWLSGPSAGPSAGPRADAPAPEAGRSPAAGPAMSASALGIRSGYRPMVDRLEAVLERRGDRLPAETRRVLERNLTIIDAAIAETEAALAENPSSPELLRTLDRTYDRKVDLLRRSARLTARL